MKRSLILLVFCSYLASAQVDSNKTAVSGFALWVQEAPRQGQATLKLRHAWIIMDRQWGSNFQVRGFFALQGPPRIVHTLFAKWLKPVVMVDYVRAGKFEPPFGHGINHYRIDRNYTINYSAIDAPVVARAHGLEVVGGWGKFGMKVAVMGGERLLGNIPIDFENRWDTYVRPSYRVIDSLTCGVSTRFGSVPARAFDVQLELGVVHLEAELISSQDTANYNALLIYQELYWLKPLIRYEHVFSQNQWTVGVCVNLPHDAEIKANAVYVAGRLQTILGQLVLRW